MNRLSDYLNHIKQATTDACSFVEGLEKEDFLTDKRTQQAVIMSLVIIGEAATKIMDGYTNLLNPISKYLGEVCAACVTALRMVTLKLIWTLVGIQYKKNFKSC